MTNTRFLKNNELDLLKSMFEFNPYSNGIKLSQEDISRWCNVTMEEINKGIRHVALTLDNNDEPVAMSMGIEKPGIAGWVQGLTMVRYPANYPKIPQAEIIAHSMDLLVSRMESKKYYKFWDVGQERILNTAKSLVARYTTMLNRYDHYDELVIPPGGLSGVALWDTNRRIHPTDSLKVRMYVLRQEHRLQLL